MTVCYVRERTKTFSNEREWVVDFYTKINSHLSTSLAYLNLEQHTTIIDASGEFEAVYEKVEEAIKHSYQWV